MAKQWFYRNYQNRWVPVVAEPVKSYEIVGGELVKTETPKSVEAWVKQFKEIGVPVEERDVPDFIDKSQMLLVVSFLKSVGYGTLQIASFLGD